MKQGPLEGILSISYPNFYFTTPTSKDMKITEFKHRTPAIVFVDKIYFHPGQREETIKEKSCQCKLSYREL